MSDHLHPIFQEALAPFSPVDVDNIKVGGTKPRTNIVSRVKHSRPVVVLEERAANEGDLTGEDLAEIDAEFSQPDATSRAMECLKQGFRESLSPFSEEEAQRIDAAMLADKQRNGYDRRREEQAAQVEADQRRARGEAL